MDDKKSLWSDRRDSLRRASFKIIPLCLGVTDENGWMSAQLTDVSRDGLGILTTSSLSVGTRLRLRLLKCELDFEVAWCQLAEKGDYLCGLEIKSPGIDLESLFGAILLTPRAL